MRRRTPLLKEDPVRRLFDPVESEHSFPAPDGATPPAGPAPADHDADADAPRVERVPAPVPAPAPLPDESHRAMVPPRWPDPARERAPGAGPAAAREPLRPGWHEWLRPGLRVAAVATAATAGVLVRFGLASGAGPLGAFTQVGRLVGGIARADGAAAHGAAAVLGLIVHVLVVTAWSLAYARVVTGWGARGRWVAAAVVAVLAWVAGHVLLPSMLRLGHGVRAPAPQVLLLHVVFALSLAVGMRLALEADDEL